MIPVETKIINKLDNLVQDQKTSFEELLLQKLKPGDNLPKPRRHKVALGAEIITHDVLERKTKEQKKKLIPKQKIKKEKKNEQKKMTSKSEENKNQTKEQDEVVYLRNISKKNIQLQRFVAKEYTDLPYCLQKQESDNKKVKIISNILIKKADKMKNNKEEKKNENRKEKNVFKNPKPGPSGLCKTRLKRRRSHSSTSVSGSISSHSDSDIINIKSDTSSIDDVEHNTKAKILNKENVDRNILIPDLSNEEYQKHIYNVGDNVLLRYYTRQKWTYYIGIIENIKLIYEEFCYSIKFYKTIKKPKLVFKMTKTCDHDDVSEMQIVKRIDLTQDPKAPNNFFMCSDENLIYF